jgi:hypothetical protein
MYYSSCDDYYNNYDSDSSGGGRRDDEMSIETIRRFASKTGYRMCQHDRREGVVAFEKPDDEDGNRLLVRVWYRTGTVGTYLKHPRQGKTQMFRRDVGNDNGLLGNIFANPRIHTNLGYQTKPNAPNATPSAASARTVPCPACGRLYKSASGSVSHFESGGCPSCPGAENARRTAYDFVNKQNANFMVPRLGCGDESEAGGYRADGANYRCQGCRKEFKLLNSLMQHQEARAQCRAYASQSSQLRLGN